MPDDIEALNTLLDNMGSSPAEPPAPTPDPTPPAETTPAPSSAPTDSTPPPAPPAQLPADKAAQAFAQMRIQNSQMQKALEQAAQLAGLEKGTPIDKIPEMLQAKLLEKQAQTQNVPLELLQQMEVFKAKAEAFERAQMEQAALAQFKAVQTTHGLTEQQVIEFAQELDNRGLNAFQTPGIDLVKEYRNIYFDTILQRSIDAAVQKALGTQQAAADHGSKPGTKSGPSGDTSKATVNTVQGLEAMLNGLTAR